MAFLSSGPIFFICEARSFGVAAAAATKEKNIARVQTIIHLRIGRVSYGGFHHKVRVVAVYWIASL
jgi:hypothetical protein